MSLSGTHLSFSAKSGTIETGYNDLFLFCFWEDFTMIDLHQEDEKLFALVGACQRDVLLRSSPPRETPLTFSHYFLLVYL